MSHPRPFYYLENFCTALDWLQQRYGDLLSDAERRFMGQLRELPRESAGLLVRMIGRKGDLFRTLRLKYLEVGCPVAAAAPLIELGWVDGEPTLTFAELSRLLLKSELILAFAADVSGARAIRKADLLLLVAAESRAACRRLLEWWPGAPDVVYRLAVNELCERLRLLFFGNFDQDWSEFVLTDLGIFKYETVSREADSRAFQTRAHVESFHALYLCRRQLEEGIDPLTVLAAMPGPIQDNDWLEERRSKVQFQMGQALEKQKLFADALALYLQCSYRGSRLRAVRMLELLGRAGEALELAMQISEQPVSEIETQLVARMLPRLRSLPLPRSRSARVCPVIDLVLPVNERPVHLESAVGEALAEPEGPVFYVENGLMSSLFGLLCWEAIFTPVPGAFFHEFQSGPADLHLPQFRERRGGHFDACLAQLDSREYVQTILATYALKQGIQSPFVFWGLLTTELLDLALACLPPAHLKACFERILTDVRANRCGWPDLIQFWPQQQRYRLIEVKGPGDRLQDNQLRWMSFFAARAIPVSVCQVSWCPSQ